MPRFYCPLALTPGLEVDLPAGPARHVQVLRLQPGDKITLFNNGPDWDGPVSRGEYVATVTRMGRSDVRVEVGEHQLVDRPTAREVHLAVGMPANDRMDWLVEKATELGVHGIQPLVCERSVLRLSGERAEKKVAHWQSIAISASEQCGGNQVPKVHPMRALHPWLASGAHVHAMPCMLSLRDGARPLHLLAGDRSKPLIFLSGPEGGLSPSEEDAAIAAGFAPVSLGARILRAETAAMATLAALSLMP
jgi:16S rRNA (uracil1498-N3)-methyltransferase